MQQHRRLLQHILERVDWIRDIHFQTKTTIDTLDYSGTGINQGSKVVIAAVGDPKRSLCDITPIKNSELVFPGVIAYNFNAFTDYETAEKEIEVLSTYLTTQNLKGVMLIVLADDASFVAEQINNFLWTTFTRSNPAKDIYGVDSSTTHKHWGCKGPLIIDARIKPHNAPALIKDSEIEKRVDKLFDNGGSLFDIINKVN